MKKIFILAICSFFFGAAQAQSDSLLKKLDSARKFLATTDLVYPYIDTPPGYPGGDAKWSAYISGSTIMKEALLKAKEAGAPTSKHTVVVKFAINADGTLGDVTTTNKPVGFGLEEAAIKLVQGSGTWIPAHVEGSNTKGYLSLPIHFTLVNGTR